MPRRVSFTHARAGFLIAGVAACNVAAQSPHHFEPPMWSGGPTGAGLGGQQGWYVPASSNDFSVFTYAGNSFGFSANPAGDAQFIAGTSGPLFNARAEHAASFSGPSGAALRGAWTVSWDVTLAAGPLVGGNMGSFTLQPATTSRVFLCFFNAAGNGTWSVAFAPFNATTGGITPPGIVPTPNFAGLFLNTWHRVAVVFSFDTNRIHRISVTNLSTGAVASVVDPVIPTSGSLYYLLGGASPSASIGLPTAMRFFASGTQGSAAAYDNLVVHHCEPDCNYDGTLSIADFACFQTAFVNSTPYADCNQSGGLTIADFACFQSAFVAGCP